MAIRLKKDRLTSDAGDELSYFGLSQMPDQPVMED